MLSGSTTTGKVTVRVQLFLATVRTCRHASLGITDRMSVPLFVQLLHIDNRHRQLWQVLLCGIFRGRNLNIGTVMVELISRVSGPGEGEETLVRVGTSWDVLWDLNRPLVVEIRAGLGVLTTDVPGLASVVRQRELAGTTAMAGLRETLGWRELCVVRDLKVPETDIDLFSGRELCDGTLLVAT